MSQVGPDTAAPPRTPEEPIPPRTGGRRFAFLLRPGWLAAIAGALLFTASCYWILAPWQFSRHHDQDVQNSAVLSAVAAEPVPLTDQLNTSSEPAPGLAWRRVTLTGRYEAGAQVYALLRQDNNGNPADEVVVPFRLPDGSAVMIDRGYVPLTDLAAGKLPAALPSGTVSLTARVQADWEDPKNRPPVRHAGRTEVYGLDAAELAAATDTPGPIRKGYLQLTADSAGSLQTVALPQVDDGPFLSYALQWLGFGAMSILGVAFFIYREAYHPLDEDGHEDGHAQGHDRDHGLAHERAYERASVAPDEVPAANSAHPTSAAAPAAHEVVPVAEPTRRRRSRARFDKSTLYDAVDGSERR